jgi:protein-disulfide isomerase
MKGFYVLLAVVVVGGIAWLAYSAHRKATTGLGPEAPPPVAAKDGFLGYTMGSDSARIEITEYSDFECPFCAAFATVQMPVVREQLVETGKVRWRFRDFRLSSHK